MKMKWYTKAQMIRCRTLTLVLISKTKPKLARLMRFWDVSTTSCLQSNRMQELWQIPSSQEIKYTLVRINYYRSVDSLIKVNQVVEVEAVEVVDEVDVAQAEEEVSQVVVVDPVDEDLVEMVVADSMAVEEVDLVAVEVAVEVLGAISIKYDRCTERMYCGLNIGPNILREMIRFLGHILYIIVSLNTRIAQCCFLL